MTVGSTSPIARLQRLARPRQTPQRCELCGATIGDEHQHLLELASRQLACTCDACAVLFDGQHEQRYRRVPRRVRRLMELESMSGLCEGLHIPINLAFFYHSSQTNKVVAMYPSPAGATESLLPIQAWEDLTARSTTLRGMQSDVEALMVNHVGKRHDCFLVPIDECYKLVGLIRSQWRGLSGGQQVWKSISEYFDGLHRRTSGLKGVTHA